MKKAFLVSGLVEVMLALLIYFKSEFFFDSHAILLSKFYGLMGICFGMVNVFAFFHYKNDEFFRKFFLMMMGYFGALSMVSYGMPLEVLPYKLESTLLHLACFIVFFIIYMKNIGEKD